MKSIVSVLTGAAMFFHFGGVSAHTIEPIYSCDEEIPSSIRQIPCILRKKQWDTAAMLMERWFSENNGKNYIIDFDKIEQLSVPLAYDVQDFVIEMKNDGLSRGKVRDNLLSKLNDQERGYRDLIGLRKDFEFDFITKEDKAFSEQRNNWMKADEEDDYLHWIDDIGETPIGDDDIAKEFTGAFNKSILRLVVKGRVKFVSNNKALIIVTNGGIYFRDSYDFGRSIAERLQPLGCWSGKEPFLYRLGIGIDCLFVLNRDFRTIDDTDTEHHDYRIFSTIDTFEYEEYPFLYVKVNNNGDFEISDDPNDQQVLFHYMEEYFEKAYKEYGGRDKLGTMTSEGTHCWADSAIDPDGIKCRGGVWIRDYSGGVYGDGDSALIYNVNWFRAYLVSEGFWGYYKLFSGYRTLGSPLSDELLYDDGSGKIRQNFEGGYLVWSPEGGYSYPAWGITQYDNKNNIVYPGGPGTSTQPDPTEAPASGKLPDFITDKVTLANQSGSKEQYTWKINETAYVHSWTDNIGDADWEGSAEKIKVAFYLSKGTKEDDHSEWIHIGERQGIKKDKLKVSKAPWPEKIEFKLQDYADNGTVMPGRTYNFVVCADRPKDENNGDGDVKEKHKSNNCSTEAVFYVDYGPPRNIDLLARNLALTGGRSSLQAGEKYGLQVEVSNIGTEQPWNGFSTNYEIKGPGTGGVWQRIGEDTSRASSLYPNATHFEAMDGDSEVNAPMVGGDYVFRACADYSQAVPETDESNNCTDELPVYIAPPPMPDIITEGLQLTHGRTSLIAGELYGLTVNVRNIGDVGPDSYSYTKYEIKGPGTNDQWQQVAEDGTMAEHLVPGMAHWEEIADEEGLHIPAVSGTYTARACADYKGNIPESDEGNNCSEITFEVEPVPAGSPRIVITNPTHDDDWRSDETDHDVRWDHFDFPTPGNVRVEYSLDGGATWLLIDDNTTNDGKKHWEDMCDFHTIDTHHAYIRVTSLEYPYVYDVSDEFTIDHAAECE